MVQKSYSKKTEKQFVFILSAIFIILTFFVIKDIFSLIIYAGLLSYFLYPLHKKLCSKIKKNSLSTLLTLTISIVLFFVPMILLFFFLLLNLLKLVSEYRIYIENPALLNSVFSSSVEKITNSNLLSSFDYSTAITSGVKYIIAYIQNFFSSIPVGIFYLFIVLFITYYMLLHHRTIFLTINHYLPLSLKKQNDLLKNIEKNIKVLFKGYFLTGILQTFVALIGYLFFGVNNILIVVFLTFLTSLIPYLGTPMVWVPISFFFILSGDVFNGAGLLLYGMFIISMVDNIARPYLMSDKDTISPALVFIGFMGGLIAFGFKGIILGPIIISITSILLRYLSEGLEMPKESK